MGKQTANTTAVINLDDSHDSFIIACAWARYCTRTGGADFLIYVYLFAFLTACSASLGEKQRPGENNKKIRFLLVLDKICTGKKGTKRIDLQNNARAEPEGTLHNSQVKNIYLCCFLRARVLQMNPISHLKSTANGLCFIRLQSITSMASVLGA